MHEGASVVVVFAGGGTGGHLYPALALADALVRVRPDVRPVFVGAERGIEARILPDRGFEHYLVPVRGLRRDRLLANVGILAELARSIGRVRALFRRLAPELVVVTGGYAAAPAGLAARLSGVPLALQEQNSYPGFTTKRLAAGATQIHVAFPEAIGLLPGPAREKAVVSGNPIRPPGDVDPRQAREGFGLDPDATVLVIVGTSAGTDSGRPLASAVATKLLAPMTTAVEMLNAVAPPVSCCCDTTSSPVSTMPLLLASS